MRNVYKMKPSGIRCLLSSVLAVVSMAITGTNVAEAQGLSVSGRVTDARGGEISGATVIVKGDNTRGTTTDAQGQYAIEVLSSDDVLVFSFLGYKTAEVAVRGRKTLNVQLEEDATLVDEVVVVGYGTQKRQFLVGSVSQVSSKELLKAPMTNVSNMMTGKLPGVTSIQRSGQPGSDGTTIFVRGVSSFNNSSPLCIVDGVERMINTVNPNDIESFTVLKDASAAAIYGSRASNGVILIQTKRGSQGEFHVTYKTKLAIAEPMQRIETMGPNEFIRLKQDMGRLKNNYSGEQLDPLVGSIISASEKVNYAKGITNDWQDYVFRTVFTMDHQLSFQGGNEKTTYMASVSYLDNPGVVYNSNYQRTNVYASINQKMNDWLSVGLTTQFVNRETGGATPNLEHAIKQSP